VKLRSHNYDGYDTFETNDLEGTMEAAEKAGRITPGMRQRMRQVITGSEDKRIRDHIRDSVSHSVSPGHASGPLEDTTMKQREAAEAAHERVDGSMEHTKLKQNRKLWKAARDDDIEAIQVALAEGASINCAGADGWTALHHAADTNACKSVPVLLLKGIDVSLAAIDQQTALHIAASCGGSKVIASLLEAKAEINQPDRNGCTALMCAAMAGHVQLVSQMIDSKADPMIADVHGRTALHRAAAHGAVPIVECLIDLRTDVNAKDKQLQTALHHAAAASQGQTFQFLAQHGADFIAEDEDKNTALDLVPDPTSQQWIHSCSMATQYASPATPAVAARRGIFSKIGGHLPGLGRNRAQSEM